MNSNKMTLQKKLEHFETACRGAGLKVTHQRLEIFRELAKTSDHPTAEALYKRLQKHADSFFGHYLQDIIHF